jgi:hypothetical protein
LKRSTWQIALVLVLFVLALLKINSSSGTDLTASFVSCRLIRAGEISHLYSHDQTSFNLISDPAWQRAASIGGANTQLVPFVQTPLWPYVLQPLCGSMQFSAFNELFKVTLALCFAALIWVTGRYWTTRFFRPQWVLLMAILWVRADPLREAMELTQTHAIFVLLTVLAILLARLNRPVWAGILLAISAQVKITPAAIVLYWLLMKQRRAALSFVLASVVLFVSTMLLVGRAATVDYLHSMARVSNVLLLAGGNQSMAAWWMGLVSPKAQALTFRELQLGAALKFLCSGLTIASAILGAYLDRRLEVHADGSTAPYGAILALLGTTIFAPIAWNHYYLILVVPLILVLDECLGRRSYPLLGLFVSIVALASSPNLLRHAGYLHLPVPDLVRGQFYAGLLAMAALYLLYRRRRGPTCSPGRTAPESG